MPNYVEHNKLVGFNRNEFVEAIKTKTVQVFFLFTRIGEIDTMNERFQAEVRIESKWVDNELNFGDEEAYDSKKHWNPKLHIENALQLTKEDITYNIVRDDEIGIVVTEVRLVKGFFWERLELQHFPIDCQELSIVLVSSLEQNELKLVSDKHKLSHIDIDVKHTFTDQQKW